MKKGTIYNLCYNKEKDDYRIEEFDGWLDLETRIGYYKNGERWFCTDLFTGCKCTKCGGQLTRKEMIEQVDKMYIIIGIIRTTAKYSQLQNLFERTMENGNK